MNMNNIGTLLGNLWNDKNKNSPLLENKQILKIGSILQNIFENNEKYKDNIEIPRLVVVGSQSSGKSSLLNGILSFDLLPTGSNMVTRTPLHLELIPDNNNLNFAEFGYYKNDKWIITKKLKFSLPTPLYEEKIAIIEEIKKITISIVGNNSNIGYKPINLKIYSKNIPNLTLIDLPGLTMVACTDKGQPKDIKDKIKQLVGSYINHSKTIILAVMPARTDLEADIALDLIKQYDPNGDRTIGILTKVDLMNDNTDIVDYLENNVSKDLQLKYGYFAVRNRTPKESKNNTIKEAYVIEENYFSNHPSYSKMVNKSNLGLLNMTNKISEILVNKIKDSLPTIQINIDKNLSDIKQKLIELGDKLPDSNEGKVSLIHSLITNFNKQFISTIQDRGVILNTGRNIKNIFIQYRKELDNVNPFKNNNNYEYIKKSIENSEGNHMSTPIPSIEVLEQCLKDPIKQPIYKLMKPSYNCCQNVCKELYKLIDDLLKPLSRFPNLVNIINKKLSNEIIAKYTKLTNSKILDLFSIEENYIWTDNSDFRNNLTMLFNNENNKQINNTIIVKKMNELLKIYYDTIIINFKNNIPKVIMYFLIHNIEENLTTNFYESILNIPCAKLLQEESTIHKKRSDLKDRQNKLIIAKDLINTISFN